MKNGWKETIEFNNRCDRFKIDAYIEIFKRESCWYASASYVFPDHSSESKFNSWEEIINHEKKLSLEVVLNGPGKNKAVKKLRRELAFRFQYQRKYHIDNYEFTKRPKQKWKKTL